MIYLNNAATSYPKPDCVAEALSQTLAAVPQSQYRSFGQDAFSSGDVMAECRRNLAELFHIKDPGRIFFTSGATEALNQAVCGLTALNPHMNIITTATEHNSVLRPLYNHPSAEGCHVHIVPCGCFGHVDPADIETAIQSCPDTDTSFKGAIIINHCSNVTGAVQDMEAIGKIAKRHGFLFIADASQSAGCLSIDAEGLEIDMLIFTGHKSLLGIQGTGGFYLAPGLSMLPLKFGGTGSRSSLLRYEEEDYDYEPGTQNLPGIAALNAGVKYILERGTDKIFRHERRLMEQLYNEIEKITDVRVYGTYSLNQGPLMSFNIDGLTPSDTAYILYSGYGILVRTGLQCAPLIHPYLGCPKEGCVRVSLSCATSPEDISALLNAVGDITKSLERKPHD